MTITVMLDGVREFRFLRPLACVLSPVGKGGTGLYAGISALDIYAYGKDLDSLTEDLYDELRFVYEHYALGDESCMDRTAVEYGRRVGHLVMYRKGAEHGTSDDVPRR